MKKLNHRLSKFSILLTGTFLTASCTSVIMEKRGAVEIIEGERALERMEYDAAHDWFKKVLKATGSPVIRGQALVELADLCEKRIPQNCAEEQRIAYLKEGAELQNQRAIYELGEAYRAGDGVPQDPNKAKAMLTSIKDVYPQAAIALAAMMAEQGGAKQSISDLTTQAMAQYHAQAAMGNDAAMISLARLYRDGTLVQKDPKTSAYWYRQAISVGNTSAAVELANLWTQMGLRSNAQEDASKLLIQAAGAGDMRAMKSLAQLYSSSADTAGGQAAAYWFEKAAEKGDVNSMALLGGMLLNGEGVTKNVDRGLGYLNQAASQGSGQALLVLGRAYRDGVNVPQNLQKGMEYINQAAARGEPGALIDQADASATGVGALYDPVRAVALYQQAASYDQRAAYVGLGEAYANGRGVPRNDNTAFDYYKKAADLGSTVGMRRLAEMYQGGRGTTQNYDESARYAKTAADAGDVIAMGMLGEMYANGTGVPRDTGEAYGWYEKAARTGHVPSMFKLALLIADSDPQQSEYWLSHAAQREPRRIRQMARAYEKGEGVTRSMPKAMAFYQRAAAMGDQQAVTRIAQLTRVPGRPKDPKAAFAFYERSAKAGDTAAMIQLANAYDHGYGTDENKEEAANWMKKAASAGNADAMVQLGKDAALSSDAKGSIAWYKKAAEAGSAEGQYQIGLAYAQGLGVEKDTAAARQWLSKAKANGYPLAETVLLTLTSD